MNDFDNDESLQPKELEIIQPSALESITRAEVDISIATAHRFPRPNLAIIKRQILAVATMDQETAESCFYSLKRGKGDSDGKAIKGPSVRLAEIAISEYGNLKFGARVIANDGKTVTAQGICQDLEKNITCSVEIKRGITYKDGRTYSQDMQTVTGQAACAIALRNAVLKVIPMAVLKPIYLQCIDVAIGKGTNFSEKRDKVFDRFAKMHIGKDRILAYLEKKSIEEVDGEDLADLIGIGTSIKDGETKIEDAFPPPTHPGTTTRKAEPVTGATTTATTQSPAKEAEKPATTTAPATNVVQMPQQTQQAPSAPAEDPEEAAAKAEAVKAREEAAKKAATPPAPPAETAAPAPKAKVPDFDAAIHIPMMRAKIAEKGIAIGQLAQYAKTNYGSNIFAHLDKCVEAGFTGKPFCMVLFRHLEKPETVALIKTLPGASTVEA
jgi:hypothetical protein